MGWRLAADLVLVTHLGFVVFIVVGAVLIRWFRWVIAPHLAALAYGAAIQSIGFACPLTRLEKDLLSAGGETVYEGGFIGHYITPILYPGELTTADKLTLVAGIAAVNVCAYAWLRLRVLRGWHAQHPPEADRRCQARPGGGRRAPA